MPLPLRFRTKSGWALTPGAIDQSEPIRSLDLHEIVSLPASNINHRLSAAMSSKANRLLRKSTLLQAEALTDLQALVKGIERAETLLAELKRDTEAMNARHQQKEQRSTREDIAYLEDLLKCARKKLAWEKQMEHLATRTPAVLATVSSVMNEAHNPPPDQLRLNVLDLLQKVQTAMSRLDAAKAMD